MPNWNKRVLKERAGDLAPGETLRAASYFQGRGSAMGQIAFGMTRGLGRDVLDVAGATADKLAERSRESVMRSAKEGDSVTEGSIAATLPNDKGVVAVTDQRIIVFGYKQGAFSTKILDPVASIPHEQVEGWSYHSGTIASSFNLAFTDGSEVGIELPRANDPDSFARSLDLPPAD